MDHSHSYSLLQFCASPIRDERLNIGLLLIGPETMEVRFPKRLDKLKSISAALDIDNLRETIESLVQLDEIARSSGILTSKDRIELINGFSSIQASKTYEFFARDTAAYEYQVDRLIETLINPEPAMQNQKLKRSKLLSFVKAAFRQEGVLARKGEDVNAHRVVVGVPIAEGLRADLLLKNGAMHVIETVDATKDDASSKKAVSDIAVSALVLEQARMTFGNENTRSLLVYEFSSALERLVVPSLYAVEHQGAQLFNWSSRDDRNKLVSDIASLATPYIVAKAKRPVVHASAQDRLKLN